MPLWSVACSHHQRNEKFPVKASGIKDTILFRSRLTTDPLNSFCGAPVTASVKGVRNVQALPFLYLGRHPQSIAAVFPLTPSSVPELAATPDPEQQLPTSQSELLICNQLVTLAGAGGVPCSEREGGGNARLPCICSCQEGALRLFTEPHCARSQGPKCAPSQTPTLRVRARGQKECLHIPLGPSWAGRMEPVGLHST